MPIELLLDNDQAVLFEGTLEQDLLIVLIRELNGSSLAKLDNDHFIVYNPISS